jgi:hypothetical protein
MASRSIIDDVIALIDRDELAQLAQNRTCT